jgi:Fur family transcriptional regulator, ferric uptake regulator
MSRHQNHSHPEEHRLSDELRRNARKLTGPRKALLEALQRQDHPVTIKEITARLKTGCDLTTIYRSMHLLETLGLVKRFDFGDGIARFELVQQGEDDHHHHLICTGCSRVVEIEDCFPEELEERIARGNGFASITHRLEFFGVCPECQEK